MSRFALFFVLVAPLACASEPLPAVPLPPVLAGYLETALRANLALQREQRDADSAQARLDAARGALLPRIDLAARYTASRGGRTIEFPVGDLLNPVYRSLDALSGTSRFPTLENQSIAFLRREEQETKLRLIQPLYRPELSRGHEAARAETAAASLSVAAFKRELRLAVVRGYFRWQQARAAVDILASATDLTHEALRVNRALVAADAATEDAVLRVEAEVQGIRQQHLAAEADLALAQAYFNVILDRPADAVIDATDPAELERLLAALRPLAASRPRAGGEREELAALERAGQAADHAARAARSAQRPTVSLAVESGIQGSSYRHSPGAGFTQASLVAEWNLFDGRRSGSRERQARNEQAKVDARRSEVQRQLSLQADDAWRRFVVAVASLDAARSRQAAARRVFQFVSRRNREGLVNQLGYLDARHELTSAELNEAATRSALFIAHAELDRALVLSPLP